MANSPKLSVIVPIYNAGNYLTRCLDTIINQTLSDIEIILILDCPTDGSDKIAAAYAQKDPRIKLIINDVNLHIGCSRNRGIEIASGEFIAFSDHDDFRELDMYENLYNTAIQQNADIVISKNTNYIDGKYDYWDFTLPDTDNIRDYCLSNLIGFGNYEKEISWFCNIHNILYKKSIIDNNSIQFCDTHICTPEDVLFNIQTFYFAKKIFYLNKPYYYHYINRGSESMNYRFREWRKRSNAINQIYLFLCDHNCYEQYKVNFFIGATRTLLSSFIGIIIFRKGFSELRKAYRHIKSLPFTAEAFSYYKRELSKKSLPNRIVRKISASLFARP